MTSHAAVVARGMGKPCVSGCQSIEVDAHKETVTLPDGKVCQALDQKVAWFRLPFDRLTRV